MRRLICLLGIHAPEIKIIRKWNEYDRAEVAPYRAVATCKVCGTSCKSDWYETEQQARWQAEWFDL